MEDPPETKQVSARGGRRLRRPATIVILAVVALFVPFPEPRLEAFHGEVYEWDMDEELEVLEATFDAQRQEGCDDFQGDALLGPIRARLERLRTADERSPLWEDVRNRFFQAAARFAACPSEVASLMETYAQVRIAAKDASRSFRPEDRDARRQLYGLLYGSRMALEEVLLQLPAGEMPALLRGRDEPSESPGTLIHGIQVHSGDILVSRGGAPTSAMIARGNDFPGNFSHVALVHVDEEGVFRTIESHIERGVVVDDLARYEDDTKLRVMLLRPRADLRPGEAFAHAAAEHAIRQAEAAHIPYDFQSNLDDASEMFCSEVASHAYRHEDIFLWRGLTTMSGPGVARWLVLFGVRHFETFGPSDLEYDEQLVVVAEWRNPDVLHADHLDNAVMDVMLEGADAGDTLGFPWWKLPVARLAKLYSLVLNLFGKEGPVPEGMDPQAALRAQTLADRHESFREEVEAAADAYRETEGHAAPYWTLLGFASEAVASE
jgi:hypothetical protein